ncbi:MAG TPA: hypothetical protein VMU88_01365 [bacterium]|nr:hypothetical protein [bacterium]
MKKTTAFYFTLAAALLPVFVQATTLHPLIGLGAEFGGKPIAGFENSDYSMSYLSAGQGFSAFGGVDAQGLINLNPFTLDLQATIGIKYTPLDEPNANIYFFRLPVELLAFIRLENLRLGAGPVYHFINIVSYTGSGITNPGGFNLDAALGLTVQMDYTFGQHWNLGLRFTTISYDQPDTPSVNGDNVGCEFSYFL